MNKILIVTIKKKKRKNIFLVINAIDVGNQPIIQSRCKIHGYFWPRSEIFTGIFGLDRKYSRVFLA